MSREVEELLTLEQARQLFPEGGPSKRWISKEAKKVGAYVKIGRRAYVTSDIVTRIREWQNAHGAERANKASGTSFSPSPYENTAPSSGDGVSTALDALESLTRKR